MFFHVFQPQQDQHCFPRLCNDQSIEACWDHDRANVLTGRWTISWAQFEFGLSLAPLVSLSWKPKATWSMNSWCCIAVMPVKTSAFCVKYIFEHRLYLIIELFKMIGTCSTGSVLNLPRPKHPIPKKTHTAKSCNPSFLKLQKNAKNKKSWNPKIRRLYKKKPV